MITVTKVTVMTDIVVIIVATVELVNYTIITDIVTITN
jgi:hypothetical protein